MREARVDMPRRAAVNNKRAVRALFRSACGSLLFFFKINLYFSLKNRQTSGRSGVKNNRVKFVEKGKNEDKLQRVLFRVLSAFGRWTLFVEGERHRERKRVKGIRGVGGDVGARGGVYKIKLTAPARVSRRS